METAAKVKSKNNILENKVKNAPGTAGVYLMRDEHNKVIYVGKSRNLRTRVHSYFRGKDSRPMIPFLVSRIHDLEFIVTKTEKEALILEINLIKKYKPRYNVNFKDDKYYFSIRIDLKEKFPRFQLVRRIKKDGAKYFGPYSSSAAVKKTLHYIQKIFPLRTCKDVEFRARTRPCMEFEIKRCLAPCCDFIGSEEYRKIAKDAVLFMEGHGKKLIAELKSRMKTAAKELNFEEATEIRNRIGAIKATLEKQRVVSMSFKDRDVFGLYGSGDRLQVCLLYIRNGSVLGTKNFPLFQIGVNPSEAISSLLKQYYDDQVVIPREIIIPENIEDRKVIEEWLTEKKKGKKVSIVVPKRGERTNLISIAASNAENVFNVEKIREADEEKAMKILVERLHLKKMPHRIECFDISNVGGRYAVGSMATFLEGKPEKSGYRRFKIKTVTGADDYSMMHEVLRRRYRDTENIPDLIVVDGGKGQLNVALNVLQELEIEEPDVIGLAKESSSAHGGNNIIINKEEDRVYLPNRKNPVYLSRYPAALFLLQRIRDEAHRFAVSYYRRLKEKIDFRSLVDAIPGIGNSRKRALLCHFKDIEKIREASEEELGKIPGIGKETARRIFDHFHGEI